MKIYADIFLYQSTTEENIMSKKIILIFLTLIMVLPLLFSCKDNTEESSQTEEVNSTGIPDGMTPFGLKEENFEGREIVFTTIEEGSTTYSDIEIAAEETNGNHVNDASYARKQKLLEDYGIDVKVVFAQKGQGNYVETSIQSNACDFDVIVSSVKALAQWSFKNLLYDLTTVKDLNIKNPWWDQSATRDLSVKNHVYFLSGDILVSDKETTWITFFNKDMFKKYFPESESLYDTVEKGEWTIDKLYEYSKVVSEGNKSIADLNRDNGTFGLISQTYDGIACMMGFGQKMIAKNDEDNLILNIDNDPTKNKFLKLFDVLLDNNNTLVAELASPGEGYPAIPNNANAVFMDGRGLFQFCQVNYVHALSNSDINFQYGVLPLPKFDTNQEHYYSPSTVYWSLFLGLPVCTKEEDLHFIAYALEAMGYYGQEILQPAYYEKTIKLQKMHDDESERMLDLIFKNRIWDPASVYDIGLYLYTGLIMANDNNIASKFESETDRLQAQVDELVEELE